MDRAAVTAMSHVLKTLLRCGLVAAGVFALQPGHAPPFIISATHLELQQNCAGPPAGSCQDFPIDRMTINGPASGGTVLTSDSFAMGGQQASAVVSSTVGLASGSAAASNT